MTKCSTIVLFTLCLIHFSGSFCYSKGQTDSVKVKSKRVSFGIYAGRVYPSRQNGSGMRTLGLSNTPDEDSHSVTFPASSEKGVAGTNAGFYLEVQPAPEINFFFSIGLNYTQISYETKNNTTFYLSFHGNASPYTFYDTTTHLQIKENYQFFSLPLSVYYRIKGKYFSYSFGGGASLAVYWSNLIETPGVQYGTKQTQYKGDDPFGVVGTLFIKIGAYLNLDKTMLLGFEPEFKHYDTNKKSFTLGGNLVLKF